MAKRAPKDRISFGNVPHILDIPSLIEFQKSSYERFLQKDIPPAQRANTGLQAVFNSVFPISNFSETAAVEFASYAIGEPALPAYECKAKNLTYSAPLKIKTRFSVYEIDTDANRRLLESREQEMYVCDIPIMTETGSFVVNGTERVIVSQLQRSPGIYLVPDADADSAKGKAAYMARIIPVRGPWLDFRIDDNLIYAFINKKSKLPATTMLRALGHSDKDILQAFYPVEGVELRRKNHRLLLSPCMVGAKAKQSIIDPATNKPIVKEGDVITRTAFQKINAANIRYLQVLNKDIIGRVTAEEIVHSATGEVLLDANEEITAQLLDAITTPSRSVDALQLLYIDKGCYSPCLRNTLLSDKATSREDALREIYRRLRPGEPVTTEAAQELFNALFFNPKKYDLSPVGRAKINKRLNLDVPSDVCVLTTGDIIEAIRGLLYLNAGWGSVDDIDHLDNRRVRGVGELFGTYFRRGLTAMQRASRDQMAAADPASAMPNKLINPKPVAAMIREFFGSSQLSQFMDQINPLAELTHKRRLSALGPGGLTRERAGFEVRDVHSSHYGRICPIETPEGPNVGLMNVMSVYARVNKHGFLEAPYRKVLNGHVTGEVEYMDAGCIERFVVSEATTPVDENGKITGDLISVRVGGDFKMVPPSEVQYADVSPKQIVSIAASLIPFLENDDANRAMMGSNMQRQAVPLISPEAPIVGTGMERVIARDSGWVVTAKRAGVVESVSSDRVVVANKYDGAADVYHLVKFARSNHSTCMNQRPVVQVGDKVEAGAVLADGPSMEFGEIALGRNAVVAFMPWQGYNFEDAMLLSERLAKDDVFTSIHIAEFEVEARNTQLGPQEITRDVPEVGDQALSALDESGIIRVGSAVKPGGILVGRVTPRGETVLTPEEKLLQAILGVKSRDVKECCLYAPPGVEGVVSDVQVLTRKGHEKTGRAKQIEAQEIERLKQDTSDEIQILREQCFALLKKLPGKRAEEIKDLAAKHIEDAMERSRERMERIKQGDTLPSGVNKVVKVFIAMKRKIQVGDKMAGRHGNKGVVSLVLPEEDMPYLPDGTPVDIVLNPLGVPSRMNVGQILELHLGWAAQTLGLHVAAPVFEGPGESEIGAMLKKAGLPVTGQVILHDGRTGEPFERPVTVGCMYMLKLNHLAADKIHGRSIGPYSLITQQPLEGKAQFGGQRLGEMEIWALEAYGAANMLQEFVTVKSDDIPGRSKMYRSIVDGLPAVDPGTPESFNVLVRELQSLGLNIELKNKAKEGD